MSTDPTAEHIDNGEAQRAHIDTIADVIARRGFVRQSFAPRDSALDLLTSTDPAVHAALAASLPAEVMLAALVDRGTLERIEARVMFGEPVCEFYRSTEWREVVL